MFPDDEEMAIAQCALAECVAFHQAYPNARSAIQAFNDAMGIEIDDYCDVEARLRDVINVTGCSQSGQVMSCVDFA